MNNTLICSDVKDYLAAKEGVWTPLTITATASRLKYYQPNLESIEPVGDIYKAMASNGLKPYYRKLVFVSLVACQDWLIAQGRANTNYYRAFTAANKQLFRNAYEDNYATISWEDFLTEYRSNISDSDMRSALALMAYGGCRLSEIYTYDGQTVMGKGSKRRVIHLPQGLNITPIKLSPHKLRRKLKHNPHAYRKLAADKYLRGGLDIKTVQILLGHTTLAATQRYLRPLQEDQLKVKLEGVWTA